MSTQREEEIKIRRKSLCFLKILCVLCGLFLLILVCSGCIDLDFGEVIGFIDTVSVNSQGKVALCMDEEGVHPVGINREVDIYITDLKGNLFTKITEDKVFGPSLAWSDSGEYLLFTDRIGDKWTLNMYLVRRNEKVNVLEEVHYTALPSFSPDELNIAYMVFPSAEVPVGNINIYEQESYRTYTLLDNAYYDYEWIPGLQKIVAVNITEVLGEEKDLFRGSLIIKDITDFSEEVIFNGYFFKSWSFVDIAGDGQTIVFSASLEPPDESVEVGGLDIYLYNIKKGRLSIWQGPDGYDFRLPNSLNSSLKGYIMAKLKGNEDEWAGQLYLIPPLASDKKPISIPGWPVWINEPVVVGVDLYEGNVLVTDLEKAETINLNGLYESSKD